MMCINNQAYTQSQKNKVKIPLSIFGQSISYCTCTAVKTFCTVSALVKNTLYGLLTKYWFLLDISETQPQN